MNADTKWFQEVKQSANRKKSDRYWQLATYAAMTVSFFIWAGMIYYLGNNWPWG